MPNTGCEPLRPLTASCSLLAVSFPTDAEDCITTKRRHLYGNPQGNIGGALPGLPYGNIGALVDEVDGPGRRGGCSTQAKLKGSTSTPAATALCASPESHEKFNRSMGGALVGLGWQLCVDGCQAGKSSA
jgi:hypothetical protein